MKNTYEILMKAHTIKLLDEVLDLAMIHRKANLKASFYESLKVGALELGFFEKP